MAIFPPRLQPNSPIPPKPANPSYHPALYVPGHHDTSFKQGFGSYEKEEGKEVDDQFWF